MSRARIAFLGPAGTFSEEAAVGYAAGSGELVPFASIHAVVEAVETAATERAIVPIENSLEGSVTATVDLLIHDTELRIVAELPLEVRHQLLGRPGTELGDVRIVISHPQAIGQCRRFLDRSLAEVEVIAALSTAAAVGQMMATEGRHTAAIATRRAAEIYGAAVLASEIQDNDANVTRFVVLAREDAPRTGRDKTSLCFTLPDARQAGALHRALACFAEAGISLTRLESRPSKQALGYYVFLIDLEGHRLDPDVAEAIRRLQELARSVKIFGSYPRWELEL